MKISDELALKHLHVMLKRGMDVNKKSLGNTPLHWAVTNGWLECTKELLRLGADVNMGADVNIYRSVSVMAAHGFRDTTPLGEAVFKGHCEIAKALIAAKADINKVDSYSYTPLHYAAKEGRADCIRALLDASADTKIKLRIESYTPLDVAKHYRHAECVHLLQTYVEEVLGKSIDEVTGGKLPVYIRKTM